MLKEWLHLYRKEKNPKAHFYETANCSERIDLWPCTTSFVWRKCADAMVTATPLSWILLWKGELCHCVHLVKSYRRSFVPRQPGVWLQGVPSPCIQPLHKQAQQLKCWHSWWFNSSDRSVAEFQDLQSPPCLYAFLFIFTFFPTLLYFFRRNLEFWRIK